MSTKKKAPEITEETVDDFNELLTQNIASLTSALKTSSESLDLLSSKVTSIACHVTALEALLSEVIKITGVDLAQVNSLIRSRIIANDGDITDANPVVDIAAAIVSPATKKS